MKTFECDVCRQVLYFENSACPQCGAVLAFLSDVGVLAAVVESGGEQLRRFNRGSATHRHCANRTRHGICNWAIPAHDPEAFCESCRLDEIIPNSSEPRARELWGRMEAAKRRLLYTLVHLGLFELAATNRYAPPLRFRFLSDGPGTGEKVLTGHASGVITINLSEADPSHREAVRESLGERYRTLLGHFRHESGHYYFEQLVARDPERLTAFRCLFGDERTDYAQALERHYEQADSACPDGVVSPYAAVHPLEDWAETWAHYLHMVDTLQTAAQWGLRLRDPRFPGLQRSTRTAATDLADFYQLTAGWLTLSVALNSMNRSMGIQDAYPFTLDDGACRKLRFVHDVVTLCAADGSRTRQGAMEGDRSVA
jgi:hypothetical protein